MAILTTRTLHYVDDAGVMKEIAMTLLDLVDESGTRRIVLRHGAPLNLEMRLSGMDALDTIVAILSAFWVRLYVGGMKLAGNLRWRVPSGLESFNCGLPALRKRPETWVAPEVPLPEENPGNLEVLDELAVSFPDSNGVEYGRPVFVFMPQQMDDTHWKCGFAFDAKDTAPVRYGVGYDWIHSFLDAMAMLRVHYEAMLPQGWKAIEQIPLERLPYMMPYKTERGYYLDHDE